MTKSPEQFWQSLDRNIVDELWEAATCRGAGYLGLRRSIIMLHIATNAGTMTHAPNNLLHDFAQIIYPHTRSLTGDIIRRACTSIATDQMVEKSTIAALEKTHRVFGEPYELTSALAAAGKALAVGNKIEAIECLAAQVNLPKAKALIYAALETLIYDWAGGWAGVARYGALRAAKESDAGRFDDADALRIAVYART